MNKPNTDLLSELFHSDEWSALKEEIRTCLHNAERELKRPGGINRDFKAGECTAYESILRLEDKYKNIGVTHEPNS